jgi:hypothetical protein
MVNANSSARPVMQRKLESRGTQTDVFRVEKSE